MFFLLIACAPPETDPGLILLGPDALDAGASLEVDGQDLSSSLPVLGYADEEIWVGLPDGEELQLQPQSGELLQVWLDGDALLYEVALIGAEIDPDAVLVMGAGGERLSEELWIEGEVDQAGLWLRAPDLLRLLTDPDLPQVEAIVPLKASASQTPGLLLETATLASPSRSVQRGTRGQVGLEAGAYGAASGSTSGASKVDSGGGFASPFGAEAAGAPGMLPQTAGSLALVGYYENQVGTQYILAADGSLFIQAEEGRSLQGFYVVDETGAVHLYVGAEGPIASFEVDPQGSLYNRGEELTRLEFACIW